MSSVLPPGQPNPHGDMMDTDSSSLSPPTMEIPAGSSSNPVHIGSRVLFLEDGAVGTVKYIGSVAGSEQVWLGIDWDSNEKRGRHDGSYQDVKYFKANGATSASFVRADSKHLHTGQTFMQAVEERYMEDFTLPGQADDLLFFGNNKVATQIELRGMNAMQDKLKQLGNLRALHLSDSPLALAGDDVERAKTQLTKVRNLNLVHCLLTSWYEVALIARNFRILQQLVLSRNPLRIPETDATEELDVLQSAFLNVTYLVLVNTSLPSWKEVADLANWFPKLTRLVLAYNNISDIGIQQPWCPQLESVTVLDLSNNPLNGGPEKIALLAHLKQLQSLSLCGCGLTDFKVPESRDGSSVCWPDLRSLLLKWNEIKTWTFLNDLCKLKNLTELSFSDNPIYNAYDNVETSRQIMVASVATLVVLNHVEISDKERRGAERDYLKRYGKAWLTAGGGKGGAEADGVQGVSADFLATHPRWAELCQIHGAPEAAEFAERSRAIKAELLNVSIIVEGDLEALRLSKSKACLQKKLPSSMTVAHLRSLTRRLFRLGPTRDLEMLYRSHRDPAHLEYPLDRDTRNLAFYEVENGDTIVVRVDMPTPMDSSQ